jgi:hypothetical protein
VIGNRAALRLLHHAALLLYAAGEGFLHCFLKILYGDGVVPAAHCQDGSFVDDVGQIRADQPGRGLGDIHQVYVRCQATVFDMHFEDRQASFISGRGTLT